MTTLDPHGIDDTRETVNEFMGKIAVAQSQGLESIETTNEMIAHFNKKGLNGGKYFIYGGIKVYPLGKTEEIEEDEQTPLTEKLHGTQDGTFEGLT